MKEYKKESMKSIEAFEYWLALGGKGNFGKVADKFGVTERTVENWSSNFNWIEQAKIRREEIKAELAKKTNKTIVEIKAELEKDINAGFNVYRMLWNRFTSKINTYLKALHEYNEKKAANPNDESIDPPAFPAGLEIETLKDSDDWVRSYERFVKLQLLIRDEATENVGLTTPKHLVDWVRYYNNQDQNDRL